MIAQSTDVLLAPDDAPPVIIDNPSGRSPLLLIGDHAGNAIPHSLGTLGLDEEDRRRHIAWDIGVAALGGALAQAADAVFVRQHYSRLVIDCNRDPSSSEAAPEISDGTVVPGNLRLVEVQLHRRVALIQQPYQEAIAGEIVRRAQAGQPTVLVSLHSFTPVMQQRARPWDIGILHDRGSSAFALSLLAALREVEGLTVGDNEPYRMDGTDYTVPRHAYPAGLPYAEIEVRQDHLADVGGVARWCRVLHAALARALAS